MICRTLHDCRQCHLRNESDGETVTDRDAFKAGFIKQCMAQGLTPDQFVEKLARLLDTYEKQASMLAKPAGEVASIVSKFLPALVAGGATMYAADELTRPSVSLEEVRDQETVNELRHYAKRVRDQNKLRKFRQQAGLP